MVVNSFTRALLLAAAGGGAAGHAQEQWQRAETDDQPQYFQGFARIYRCFFHIVSFISDVYLFAALFIKFSCSPQGAILSLTHWRAWLKPSFVAS